MRPSRFASVLLASAVLAACAPAVAGAPQARSAAGSVRHGELVFVPHGTVEDWNILVAPREVGREEPGSEADNRLLAFRVFATVFDDRSWQITAQYRFGFAEGEQEVNWVEGTASYILVPR